MFLLCTSDLYAQMITSSASSTPDQLVTQALGTDCVSISNVISPINGSSSGVNSYGSFSSAASNFPFNNGFFITTGDAAQAGNQLNSNDLSVGTTSWLGDADLETALNTSNTLNATVIEFDIVSATDKISFNYLLASEEYQLDFPCNVADGFALLIKPTGSSIPYTNMATIPNTNVPVGISTVHPEIVGQCQASNENYFEGLQLGATNYEGRTVPLTAIADVIPNQSYHIKLVVADQFDFRYDTAVFIESGSLTADVDLGNDITSCSSAVINGAVNNPLATYSWSLNGNVIPNETASTLTASTSGVYTVNVSIPNGNGTCDISDDVTVTIDPNSLNIALPDVSVCDDSTQDGIEVFDLIQQANSVLSGLNNTNLSVSFYTDQNGAMASTNSVSGNYTNTSNPQTLYVRIEDSVSGCHGIATMNLVVNTPPALIDYDHEECDIDTDQSIAFDLNQFHNVINPSGTPLIYTYYANQADADAEVNRIFSPYNNVNNPDSIVIRGMNPLTGCSSTATVNIVVNTPPELGSDFEEIDACDQDYDGLATFDLTSVEDQFTAGLTNITITYHVTIQDAETGANAIANPSVYDNTIPNVQTVYIRVVNSANGCAVVSPIMLWTNYILENVDLQNESVCDDDGDGYADFNLYSIGNRVLSNTDNIEIAFYTTEVDQLADANRLDETVPFTNTTNPQTLFIRLSSATCVEYAEIELEVLPPFDLPPLSDQVYCDQDQDTVTSILLASFNADVLASLGPVGGGSVMYYNNQQDAEAGINAIASITSVTNPVTVYVRVTNQGGCFDVSDMSILVEPAPLANDLDDVTICDNNQDGISNVDLTINENLVTSTPNTTISYHLLPIDASAGSNAINNPSNYDASTSTIYIRVENNNTGCASIARQNIYVNTQPVFNTISEYNICESNTDGTADFLFNTKDVEILNGQAGKYTSYYLSQPDAIAGTNEINKNNNYQNLSNPQTIWVRVSNYTDVDCYGVDSFNIRVSPLPEYNAPTEVEICDGDNDGFSTFDLQNKIDEIQGNHSNSLNIEFFDTSYGAILGGNPLPLNFTNTVNPQMIYVKISNSEGCSEFESFELRVIEGPTVNTVDPSRICDNNGDGLGVFDLTSRESEIIGNRPFNCVVTWHATVADAMNGGNIINNPSSYMVSTNPDVVYLRMFNTVSGCYAISELQLIVTQPPLITDVDDYLFCENEDSTVDLTEADNSFISPDAGAHLITYHETLQDANNNTNNLNGLFTYTATTTTLYVRVESQSTGCFSTDEFNVIIQPAPALPALDTYDMEVCDSDNDGVELIDVTQNLAALGNLDPATHTLEFYYNGDDAREQINQINGNIIANDMMTIHTRVTNIELGCSSYGEFLTYVNPLPVSPVGNHYVICSTDVWVDGDTGDEGDSYLWSTGETTRDITITEEGTYTLIVTSEQGCEAPPAYFTVTRSSSADLEFVTKVDFGDPNSITVMVNGEGDYLYVLDNGEPQRSNVFLNVSPGYHEVVVIDENGCDPTPPQLVLIVDYPRYFTPNQDGFHDTWLVENIDTFDSARFNVFDRFGKLLTSFDGDESGWDGTYNGNPMPSSDYWFTLDISDAGKSYQVKGHFSLKR